MASSLRSRPFAAALVVLALLGVALAAFTITDLRRDATSRRETARLVDRLGGISLRSEALGWHALALDAPDFSLAADGLRLQRQLKHTAAQIAAADRRASRIPMLAAELGASIDEVLRRAGIDRQQGTRFTLITRLLSTVDLLRPELTAAEGRAWRAAARADQRANTGTLVVLLFTALLVCAVALALVWGRRRTWRAEQRTLRRSEERHRALLEQSSEIILVLDAAGTVIDVTDAAVRRILGWDPDVLRGRPLSELAAPAERPLAAAALRRLVSEPGISPPSEWVVRHADGRQMRLEAIGNNLLDAPALGAVVLTVYDVTGRREMERELRHQAFHDALTGLPNRALFEDRLSHALLRIPRGSPGVAVLFVDLDDFKAVNDSLGHRAGDELLREVARRLAETMRATDTAARFGGDEFAVLVEDAPDLGTAEAMAARIEAALAEPFRLDDRDVAIRASTGLVHTQMASTAEELLRSADIAMYAAKADGLGGHRTFTASMLDAARGRLDLREELRAAIAGGDLTVAYQPVIDLVSGRTVALEALARWPHPVHGAVPPGQFVAVAEQSGLIGRLGLWVLERACEDLRRIDAVAPGLRMAVNVSAHQLRGANFVADVRRTVARVGVDPRRLTLELTESALADYETIEPALRALRELGVRIAIDDFGTGYSSLSRLRDLSVDAVKIDRAFIGGLPARPRDMALARSIVELAHELGLCVVAEGVEQDGQAGALRGLACEHAQGYLFGRPSPLADVLVALADQSVGGGAVAC